MHGKLSEGISVPLDYDEQWAGTADSKIFKSSRNGRFESNVEASQVPSISPK